MKSKLKKIGMAFMCLIGGLSFIGNSVDNKAYANSYPIGICSSGKCAWTAKEYRMQNGGIWLACKEFGTATCCAPC